MSKVPKFYTGDVIPGEDTIFVFGSNPEGRHGRGAAKIAREKFGAVLGVGEGLTGNSYALPTKDLRYSGKMSKESIIQGIKKLYKTCSLYPSKKFKVAYRNTSMTSLNGYTGFEMMDMFKEAGDIPDNLYFSLEWVSSWEH